MPANEQTWRDPKLLHLVFGISSIVMLITTIWMMADDHNRPWKDYQRSFRNLDVLSTQWRGTEQQSADYAKTTNDLQRKLEAAQEAFTIADRDRVLALYEKFKEGEGDYVKLATKNDRKANSLYDPDAAKDAKGAARELADEKDPKAIRAKRDKLVKQLNELIDPLKSKIYFRENLLTGDVKDARANFSAAQSQFDQAVGRGESPEKLQALQEQANTAKDNVAVATALMQKAVDERKEIESIIKQITADEDQAAKALADHKAKVEQFEKAARERESNFGKSVLEGPIIDAFGNPLKIENLWLPNLPWYNNFKDVARFDRCVTCHQGIERTLPGSATAAAFPPVSRMAVELATPQPPPLVSVYGLTLGKPATGTSGASVEKIAARSFAADAKLRVKDVIVTVNGAVVESPAAVESTLLQPANWDKPFKLTVHRGDRGKLVSIDKTTLVISYKAKKDDKTDTEKKLALRPDARLSINGQPAKPEDFKAGTEVGYVLDADGKTVEDVHAGEDVPLALEMTPASLQSLYGVQLAQAGAFSPSDVTIAAVYPQTPAAVAGLMGGDVIETMDGARMARPAQVVDYLFAKEHWGRPIKLLVRRGVPEPFTTHPRLDLFIGSLSPHPYSKFGCTICHQGQGSATAFKWASHTPNSLQQADVWTRDLQWFDNENWTYPMFPKRFEESTCLKCHHEVVELERSREFPTPPAPKVVAGYEVIRRYGCFGCHEINGFDGKKRIGPDMRLEPNYAAAAEQLLDDPGLKKLSKQAVNWATDVEFNPANDAARRGLLELLAADSAKAKKAADNPEAPKPLLDADSRRMEGVLKDVDNPGTERKVGPSLRHVGSKLDFDFMTSWIENPRDFRPNTRMPRFFGQWDHLDGKGLEDSKRFEPIEVRGVAKYLLKISQPFEYAKASEASTEKWLEADGAGDPDKEAIERGKKAFQLRGCLACHQHADFKKDAGGNWADLLRKVPAELRSDDYPELKASQGPDLSRMGAKLKGSKGRQWLYSWVKNPSRYHPRTFMPVLFLDAPLEGSHEGKDPAADVTAFLMNSQQGWKPSNALPEKFDEQALLDLVVAHLSDKFSKERADEYAKLGVPVSQAEVVAGDESLLVNPDRPSGEARRAEKGSAANEAKETDEQKRDRLDRMLLYVGRKTIGKYGCYACHDVPGFEDAKPIGTSLADWGRKLPSRLAFEQIGEYLTNSPHGRESLGIVDPPRKQNAGGAGTSASESEHSDIEGPEVEKEHEFTLTDIKDPDLRYFMEKLLVEQREGFLWQKLRQPRSYDFKKAENKKYSERLRMPKFHFADTETQNQEKIEEIMTFVLGLVSEPPPPAFIYHPTGAKEAMVSGRKVLEKFNCQGCHILEMERWDLEFKPGALGKTPTVVDFPFVMAHFTPKEIDDSKNLDRRGQLRSTIYGMPKVTIKGAPIVDQIENEDDPSKPSTPTSTFMNFQAALVDGGERVIGKDLQIPLPAVVERYPTIGGDLARYALPFAVSLDEKTLTDYKDKPNEAWGWLPPPLVGEGRKVQTQWLHDFLLDPFVIRPAAVLRMPKFNMSSAEASRLAAYFAAVDGAEYPYEFDVRTRADHLEQALSADEKHLDKALNIVVDSNFCVKCHKVGDFSPTGTPRALAPQLENVHSRLRPEYTHRWIGDPARILPYTGMPQNFPPPPTAPVAQTILKGSSEDQLDALVDLLMNFDRFAQEQVQIKSLVKPVAAAPATAGSTADKTSPPEDK